MYEKQGPHGQQKLSYLKSINTTLKKKKKRYGNVPRRLQKWLPYRILGGKSVKNVKTRNNGDMAEQLNVP